MQTRDFMTKRVRVTIEGIVQGVGFRPFVYRLAAAGRLAGWVKNTPAGVLLEVEGDEGAVAAFLRCLTEEAPPLAAIHALASAPVASTGERGFAILASGGGERVAEISPDCDVCPDCLRELFDPRDRRYRYPFINCTNCGPRYSIITGIPYDRPLTTMAGFTMCPACRAEYEDPTDRRFHAQPVACPACGPRLRLVAVAGGEVAGDPVEGAVRLLREGRIVAVKGVGGYHLSVDAGSEAAVRELRRRKQRDEKPFAVMAAGFAEIEQFAVADAIAGRLLAGPERPVVLLPKLPGNPLAPSVAPGNGWFGVMLPSSPLHHLLLRDTFTALVMTSGNVTDEPIAYRDDEARERLAGIVDYFLVHDREIHVRCDDSVLRVFDGEPLFLRRSRGYTPRGIRLPATQPGVLAVGAELKGTLCLTRGDRGYLSQHIGDLKNAATLRCLEETAGHLQTILAVRPQVVAHDLHPDYLSRGFAEGIEGVPKVGVQHHHAHMAACMAEHGLDGEVIGVVFDGTGWGDDGTIWGGEFLVGGYAGFARAGHFAPVPLPGGDAAVREPFRMALAYLFGSRGERAFDLALPCWEGVGEEERHLLLTMLRKGINSPFTSSCGRLFDAVAALLGVRHRVSYEGQAAMELEALAEEAGDAGGPYPYAICSRDGKRVLDFRLLIEALLLDLEAGEPRPVMARRFHLTVAAATADLCGQLRETSGERVVLSGGVFQNRLLTEEVCRLLRKDGFDVFTHRLVPPNDGGLALGQAVIAGRSGATFPQSRR
jgi:hydrogenase maturation protein HypF